MKEKIIVDSTITIVGAVVVAIEVSCTYFFGTQAMQKSLKDKADKNSKNKK